MKKKVNTFGICLGIGAVVLIIILSCVFYIIHNIKKKDGDVVRYLRNLKSYSCNMNIKIKNDKQNINYTCKQTYLLGSGYKLELNKKRIMFYKENKIYTKDMENKKSYIIPKDFDEVYKLTLIGEYIDLIYTNDNTKYSLQNIDGTEYAIIKIIIPNQNRNTKYALMYVNTEDNAPYKISIYDTMGNEKIQISYTDFDTNAKLDPKTFEF